MFELENVTLGYENTIVAENLSFRLNQGEYLCIVGENGTGKKHSCKDIAWTYKAFKGKSYYEC